MLGHKAQLDIAQAIFHGIATPQRDNLWLGLSTTTSPHDGSQKHELSGGGYGRVKVNDWIFPNYANPTSFNNTGVITFPTATTNWLTANSFFIATNPSDGDTENDILFVGDFSTSRSIEKGDLVQFPSGTFVIALD